MPKKRKIYDVFHILLLKKDTTKERQVNNMQLEFKAGNDKKYEVNSIWDSTVYAKESRTGQLSGLSYLVLWKGYPEEENIWKLALAI